SEEQLEFSGDRWGGEAVSELRQSMVGRIFGRTLMASFAMTVASVVARGQTTQPGNSGDPSPKAAQWVASLNLNDPAKQERVTNVIATQLTAVRDWHNEHPYTTVPEGTNPANGKKLSAQDRQFIADSAMPKSVHE